MRHLPFGFCFSLALCAISSCDIKRPPSPEQLAGGLSLKLGSVELTLQPGGGASVQMKVTTSAELNGPVAFELVPNDGADLPGGLGYSFEPEQVLVPVGQTVVATLQLAADPSISLSDFGFVVKARSGDKLASMPLLVRIAPFGPTWDRQMGTSGTDTLSAVAADSAGNWYVAVNSTGSIDGKPNAGDYDGYLLSYTSTGTLRFAAQVASDKTDYLTGVAVDKDDAVYVSGYTFGTLPGQVSFGRTDGFVARFTANGALVWSTQLGSAEIDKLNSLAVGSDGNLTAVGTTEGNYATFKNAGLGDVWIVRLSQAGLPVSSLQLGSDQNDTATTVTIEPTRNISFIAGNTAGTLPGANTLGLQDAFLLSMNADAKLGWVRQTGSSGTDEITTSVLDDAGNVWIGGNTRGTLPGQISMGGQDCLMLQFSGDGTRLNARQFGTSYVDGIAALAWFEKNLYSVGSTKGGFVGQTAFGGYDMFFSKHQQNGQTVWLNQFGTDQADNAAGLGVTKNTLFLAGSTFGTFGGQVPLGGSDGYLLSMRLYPSSPQKAD